ncbi:MAG: helix-turn-helix domain-containing protein [Usitatibacter sp.]
MIASSPETNAPLPAPLRPPRPRPRTGLAPHKLNSVLAHIEEHIAESVSVRRLADAVHTSPFHFARMFKVAMGCPPHLYVTLLRMERAKNLLVNSALPLVEIAASVGYQTQAHFTGVFHKHVGTTPRTYRLATIAARDGR